MRGDKIVTKSLIELFKGKSILFIEGDLDLYYTVGKLQKFLIENKIKYHEILNAGEMSLKGINELADFHDIIIWESQYVTKTSSDIISLLLSNKVDNIACGVDQRKILMECYIYEPHWWYKPNTQKRVLLLTGHNELSELYELKDDKKPIWEKDDDEL